MIASLRNLRHNAEYKKWLRARVRNGLYQRMNMLLSLERAQEGVKK